MLTMDQEGPPHVALAGENTQPPLQLFTSSISFGVTGNKKRVLALEKTFYFVVSASLSKQMDLFL